MKEKRRKKVNREFLQQQLLEEKARKDLLSSANSVEDILIDFVPFKKFDRNGLDLILEFQKEIKDPNLFEWTFDLLKANMQTLYDETNFTGGWNDKKEKRILKEDSSRFIFAFERESKKPVAFTHFRFDEEDDREVLYCYEIQLVQEVKRKGLGKFIMQLLELIARKHKMKWIMLTCIKKNEGAMKFYKNVMKYLVDDSDLSICDPLYDENQIHYEILSKVLPPLK